MVTLKDVKNNLRIDFTDDDEMLEKLIKSAYRICSDVARQDSIKELKDSPVCDVAVQYCVTQLYTNRENLDIKSLKDDLANGLLIDYRESEF